MTTNPHTCLKNPTKMCYGCKEEQTVFDSSQDRALAEWLKHTPNATKELLNAFTDGYCKGAEDWGDG